jgi:hypothetical protein
MSGAGDFEAGILAAIQMPGVVPLSEAGRSGPGAGPVTSTDGLEPLPDRPPLDSRAVCVLGASLSRTVAEVHRAGIVHGSISLPVVLVDELGRPVLAGFGTASRSTSPDARTLDAGDLVSLLKVLVDRLPDPADSSESRNRRRTGRLLDDLDGSPPVDISDGLTGLARSFGSDDTDQTAAVVEPQEAEPQESESDVDQDQAAHGGQPAPADRPSDEAGPPEGDFTREDPDTAERRASGDGRDDGQNAAGSDRTIRARVRSAPTGPSQLAAASFMATGLLILAAATIAFFLSRGTGEPPPEPPPLVMEGGPVVTYMGTSYRIGRPGDVSVVRSCDGQATAWLLRPSTGAIYRFEAWATDEMVIADPIRIVLGGQSLRLAHSLGCTDVHVETTDGRSVPLTDGS